MAITYIDVEQTTGQDVFSTDQSDPPLTEEQATAVAEQFMTLLLGRLAESYPKAEIEAVPGNGLGGGTCVTADTYQEEDAALAHLQSIAISIWESDDLWSAGR